MTFLLLLANGLLGHPEPHLHEKDKADEETNTKLVVDVADRWAQELALSTAQRQAEIDGVAFIAAAVHNLVVFDNA